MPAAANWPISVDGREASMPLHAEWSRKGVTILQEPVSSDFGYTFTGTDPDGHRLRVFTPEGICLTMLGLGRTRPMRIARKAESCISRRMTDMLQTPHPDSDQRPVSGGGTLSFRPPSNGSPTFASRCRRSCDDNRVQGHAAARA